MGFLSSVCCSHPCLGGNWKRTRAAPRSSLAPSALQAKQDLDQVKEIAGQAVKGLSSMASKLMSELGKY